LEASVIELNNEETNSAHMQNNSDINTLVAFYFLKILLPYTYLSFATSSCSPNVFTVYFQVLSERYQVAATLEVFVSYHKNDSNLRDQVLLRNRGILRRKKKKRGSSFYSGKAPGSLTGPQLQYLVPSVHTFKSHPG